MKNDVARISLCVMLSFAVVLVGCGKKDDEGNGKEGDGETPEVKLSDKSAELAAAAKDKAVEKYNDIAAVFRADEGKGVEEITTQAKEMAAAKLREIAQIYRDTITENREKLREMTEKFVATPKAERLGAEAQKLKEDIGEIHKGIESMREKFEVYYEALKEKAGDLTGLEL